MLPMHEAQHSFDVVLRGYDRSQVADTIERLEADFRIALADRDAAVARSADLAGQLSAMHGEIESLRRKAATASAPTFENISERIQHMLQLAEEEAGEIRRAAELDAQAVREQTAAEERALLERHAAGQAEVERMIAEARQDAEQIMQKAQLRADELVAKAQERVARLDAESQARRAKVEEDFDIAQRARRAEAAARRGGARARLHPGRPPARRRRRAARRRSWSPRPRPRPRPSATCATSSPAGCSRPASCSPGLPDLGDRAEQPAPAAERTEPARPEATGTGPVRAEAGRAPEQRPQPTPRQTQPAASGPQTAVQPAVTASPLPPTDPARATRRPPVRARRPPAATRRPGPPVSRPGQRARSPVSCRCRPAPTRPRRRHRRSCRRSLDPGDRPARRAGSFLRDDPAGGADRALAVAAVGLLCSLLAARRRRARLRTPLTSRTAADRPPLPRHPGGRRRADACTVRWPDPDPGIDVARALGYGDVGGYRELAPGSYTVSVRPAGASPATPPALSAPRRGPHRRGPHARARRRRSPTSRCAPSPRTSPRRPSGRPACGCSPAAANAGAPDPWT